MLSGLEASLDTYTQVPRVQNFLVGYFSNMGISFTNGLDLGKNFEIKILKYF